MQLGTEGARYHLRWVSGPHDGHRERQPSAEFSNASLLGIRQDGMRQHPLQGAPVYSPVCGDCVRMARLSKLPAWVLAVSGGLGGGVCVAWERPTEKPVTEESIALPIVDPLFCT